MTDNTLPRTNSNTAALDNGRPDICSDYKSLNDFASEMLYIFQQPAIAEDRQKRLIKATVDAFEHQLASGKISQI